MVFRPKGGIELLSLSRIEFVIGESEVRLLE